MLSTHPQEAYYAELRLNHLYTIKSKWQHTNTSHLNWHVLLIFSVQKLEMRQRKHILQRNNYCSIEWDFKFYLGPRIKIYPLTHHSIYAHFCVSIYHASAGRWCLEYDILLFYLRNQYKVYDLLCEVIF